MEDECSGHEGEQYQEYVEQMVSDFKKVYGGYVTAFAYYDDSHVLRYKLSKPFCKFEDTCRKPISNSQLSKIAKKLDPERGEANLMSELNNFEKLSAGPFYGYLTTWNSIPISHLDLSNISSKLADALPFVKYLVCPPERCKSNHVVLMCTCGNDFPLFGIFDNFGSGFKGTNEQGKLALNPHYVASSKCRLHQSAPHNKCRDCVHCKGKVFKTKKEDEIKQAMIDLWRLYIMEKKGQICIVCRKIKEEYRLHCKSKDHINPKGIKEVVVCSTCTKHVNACPLCLEPFT
eukprot:TRINITY_DN135808_c0_g1_i1.p2 TRINITY_DN135808_c0_g1~~TRINITY_DN135808_c0_g1_i1.p2  ORF type:complete len:322 (+),score=12.88 TRINITY_DN135808_c0_g1_i1:100-966(+)